MVCSQFFMSNWLYTTVILTSRYSPKTEKDPAASNPAFHGSSCRTISDSTHEEKAFQNAQSKDHTGVRSFFIWRKGNNKITTSTYILVMP
jgi:hypothetical protein